MEEEKFTTNVIVNKLGIPMQRIRMWLLEGFVEASYPSNIQGKKAYFRRSDLYAIILFEKLLEKGLKRELAGQYIKSLRKAPVVADKAPYLVFVTKKVPEGSLVESKSYMGFNPLKLVFAPDKLGVVIFDGEINEEQCEWEDVLVINYAKIRVEVDKMLRK